MRVSLPSLKRLRSRRFGITVLAAGFILTTGTVALSLSPKIIPHFGNAASRAEIALAANIDTKFTVVAAAMRSEMRSLPRSRSSDDARKTLRQAFEHALKTSSQVDGLVADMNSLTAFPGRAAGDLKAISRDLSKVALNFFALQGRRLALLTDHPGGYQLSASGVPVFKDGELQGAYDQMTNDMEALLGVADSLRESAQGVNSASKPAST